ncbi:MAG TPA: acetolactate synthase large subunit, partial [Leeuwenhoekiella sp.]|nr:acetolactate synthase large subunit [Leeuwenhoekiella sp.]
MDNTQTIKLQDTAVEATQRLTGKEAIIKCLLAEGVDTLYGYPGGAIMPVYDELYKYQDKLHHVLTRHEQGA